jgi:hypothetical protein
MPSPASTLKHLVATEKPVTITMRLYHKKKPKKVLTCACNFDNTAYSYSYWYCEKQQARRPGMHRNKLYASSVTYEG